MTITPEQLRELADRHYETHMASPWALESALRQAADELARLHGHETIDAFVESYEFITDDGNGYRPTDQERALITDALYAWASR